MTSLRGMLVLTLCFAILSDNTEDKQCTPRYDHVGFTELSSCNEMFTGSTFSLFIQITSVIMRVTVHSQTTLFDYSYYTIYSLMMMTSPTPYFLLPISSANSRWDFSQLILGPLFMRDVINNARLDFIRVTGAEQQYYSSLS